MWQKVDGGGTCGGGNGDVGTHSIGGHLSSSGSGGCAAEERNDAVNDNE